MNKISYSTTNSILVNASAGFNMDMAVIPKDPVKT